jgi:menaquinone-dependent protoporphyrinogen oxidase
MRILVTAASKHGATTEIAELVAGALEQHGHAVDVRTPEQVEEVEEYDAAVVGSAVYAGNWMPAAKQLLERHAAPLSARPLWLFSSGPVGAPEPKPAGDPNGITELAASLGARGHAVFAGRLDRSLLSFPERAIVRAFRAEEGDFRDWTAIYDWAEAVATELEPAAVA